MDRGARWATVHETAKESDMTWQLNSMAIHADTCVFTGLTGCCEARNLQRFTIITFIILSFVHTSLKALWHEAV